MTRRRTIELLILGWVATGPSGCGQKGPLYLPPAAEVGQDEEKDAEKEQDAEKEHEKDARGLDSPWPDAGSQRDRPRVASVSE